MNDYFLSLAEELLSKYKRVNNFTQHSVSVGRYHEEALKSTLRLFLPNRFSIKTGFVHIPKEKVVSRQCDIVIIDENEPNSYLFQDGEFVVVHPQAVVCVIEVKTRITRAEFDKIHKASKALSEVRKKAKNLKGCFYLAFGYDSEPMTGGEAQLSRWYEELPSRNRETYALIDYPAKITALNGGLGDLLLLPDGDNWGVRKFFSSKHVNSPEWRLATFLMTIRTMTEVRDGVTEHSNLDWGVDFEGAMTSIKRFRAGEGAQNSPRK